ncbi:hypothetical protein ZWY2020_056500 [Hordeum vulgare]|nr:hypothetical protein ZWY2020_056500 [Hordeum vulgare]
MENLMTRLEEIPNRVQSWKKSAARCGADVALSLVRVHCKEVREEKLKALQVANTKKLRFEDFMDTFLESATRIADGIDLDSFVEPSSPGANPDDARRSRVEALQEISVPCSRLVYLPVDVVESVCSVVQHLGDDEGSFPGRSQLVRSLLIHSEHQVACLERATPDVACMKAPQIVLINGWASQCHLALLL